MGRKPSVNLNLPPRMRARRRGDTTYYFYDTGEKPRRELPLGKDYVLAVQKWATLHMAPAPAAITVAWVIGKYLASPTYTALGAGTQADYKFALDKLIAKFGEAPIDQVRPSHVQAYLELRSTESKHRALREVAVFGRIFRYARAHEWTKNDPIEPIERKRLPGRKHIDITDDMLQAVYDNATQDLRDAIDIAYYISQRPADVLKLRETDIKDGILSLRQNKTSKPIRIAAVAGLAETIERIMARKQSHTVRSLSLLVDERGAAMTKAKLRSRFEKAREAAGIKGSDFQFRDLRRKSGTDVREQAGIEAAQAILGHSSVVMTEHYTGARGRIVSAIPSKRPAGKVKS